MKIGKQGNGVFFVKLPYFHMTDRFVSLIMPQFSSVVTCGSYLLYINRFYHTLASFCTSVSFLLASCFELLISSDLTLVEMVIAHNEGHKLYPTVTQTLAVHTIYISVCCALYSTVQIRQSFSTSLMS